MTRRLAALMTGAAALAAPASAAAAPALNPLKPCYVSIGVDPKTGDWITEDVELSGIGFTPGSQVNIAVDGNTAATNVPIDAAGNLPMATLQAPLQEKGERPFTVEVTDRNDPAQKATAQAMVTHLTYTLTPRRARFDRKVTYAGSGFTRLDRPVYAHYVLKGKVRRTMRLVAAPTGPCGTFSVKRRQFPFKPKVGRWVVQLDQQKRYSRTPSTVYVVREVFVRRSQARR